MIPMLVGSILGSGSSGAATNFYSIVTQTVGAGGVSSITFSSIPSTYTHLQIRGLCASTYALTNGISLRVQINGVSTSSYAIHNINGNGSAAAAENGTSNPYLNAGYIVGSSAPANTFSAVIMDFLDYTNSNKNPVMRSLGGSETNSVGQVGLFSGILATAGAISSITIFTASNLAQYSSFALYGVK
jgi:hypothetical protein